MIEKAQPAQGSTEIRKTQQLFDASGRLRVKTGPEGTLTYQYDPRGSVATIRGDGLNRYASGTPIETALGTNVFLEYKRDYAGRLSSVTDQPGASAKLFAYQHVFGQLDKVIFPDNRLTTDYDYDAR
ncbi:MAG: hypothetical protein AB1813_21695, partial [Verrucomicrobiota bacterium]